MRPVRYNVAATLDGCIAGPRGEYDWIPDDPAVDFAGLFARVDTVLLGRRSYELVLRERAAATWPAGARVYVFSRTLRAADHPGVTVVGDRAAETVAALRAEPGDGEIWLYGGGELFRSLLAAGQVDAVEVTVAPVLLGGGVPLLPPGAARAALRLTHTHAYPSGMVALHYAVPGARPAAAPATGAGAASAATPMFNAPAAAFNASAAAAEASGDAAGERAFVTSRFLEAAPEAVFDALRDPARLARWWGPRGFTTEVHRFEFRPGGRWHLDMHGPGGATWAMEHVFVEVDPPRRVVFDHLPVGGPGDHAFRMTIAFEDLRGRTRVHWRQEFETAAERARVEAVVRVANEQNLDRLAREVLGSAPLTVLETERLILREFDEARDAPFILRLLNEPSFIENIADKGVRTLEGAREYIRTGPAASYAAHGFGLWHVGLRGTGASTASGPAIGMCGLIRRDILPEIDVGYALLPEYAGRGYAREAAAACLRFARERVGAARVLAVVNPGNDRSLRLLRTLGFAEEGTVRMAPEEEEILLLGTHL